MKFIKAYSPSLNSDLLVNPFRIFYVYRSSSLDETVMVSDSGAAVVVKKPVQEVLDHLWESYKELETAKEVKNNVR